MKGLEKKKKCSQFFVDFQFDLMFWSFPPKPTLFATTHVRDHTQPYMGLASSYFVKLGVSPARPSPFLIETELKVDFPIYFS